MWRLFRVLARPLARRTLALLLLAGLWLGWRNLPVRPLREWSAADGNIGLAAAADAVPGCIQVPVTFLPDGRRCLLGRPHHGLTLWDLSAAQAVAKLPGAAVPGIVTPDAKTLITASWESVLLWDPQTGEPA